MVIKDPHVIHHHRMIATGNEVAVDRRWRRADVTKIRAQAMIDTGIEKERGIVEVGRETVEVGHGIVEVGQGIEIGIETRIGECNSS